VKRATAGQVLLGEHAELGVAGLQPLDQTRFHVPVQVSQQLLDDGPGDLREVVEQPVAEPPNHGVGVGLDTVVVKPGANFLAKEIPHRIADLLHLVPGLIGDRRLLRAGDEPGLVSLVVSLGKPAGPRVIPSFLEAAVIIAERRGPSRVVSPLIPESGVVVDVAALPAVERFPERSAATGPAHTRAVTDAVVPTASQPEVGVQRGTR